MLPVVFVVVAHFQIGLPGFGFAYLPTQLMRDGRLQNCDQQDPSAGAAPRRNSTCAIAGNRERSGERNIPVLEFDLFIRNSDGGSSGLS